MDASSLNTALTIFGTGATLVALVFALIVVRQQSKSNREIIEAQLEIAKLQIATQTEIAKKQLEEQAFERWAENLRHSIVDFNVSLGELAILLSDASGLAPEDKREPLTNEKKILERQVALIDLLLNPSDNLHVQLAIQAHACYKLVLNSSKELESGDESASKEISKARLDLLVLATRVLEECWQTSDWKIERKSN